MEKPVHFTVHRVNTGTELERAEAAVTELKKLCQSAVQIACETDLVHFGKGQLAFIHGGIGKMWKKNLMARGWGSIPQMHVKRLQESELVKGIVIHLKQSLDSHTIALLNALIDQTHEQLDFTISSFFAEDMEKLSEEGFKERAVLQQLVFTSPYAVLQQLSKKIEKGKISMEADQVVTWRPRTLEGYDRVSQLIREKLQAQFYPGGLVKMEDIETNLSAQVSSGTTTAGGYLDLHHAVFGWRTALGKGLGV